MLETSGKEKNQTKLARNYIISAKKKNKEEERKKNS